MNEQILQKTSGYSRNDLIGIIKSFASACSDRAADADFACALADKYDPIFNCEEVEEDEDEEI
jgi:hypothetical protein|tara:strand:+ start:177 stop:365 length:189 start_codon:yes stop_codon:yes gene_type:complete